MKTIFSLGCLTPHSICRKVVDCASPLALLHRVYPLLHPKRQWTAALQDALARVLSHD